VNPSRPKKWPTILAIKCSICQIRVNKQKKFIICSLNSSTIHIFWFFYGQFHQQCTFFVFFMGNSAIKCSKCPILLFSEKNAPHTMIFFGRVYLIVIFMKKLLRELTMRFETKVFPKHLRWGYASLFTTDCIKRFLYKPFIHSKEFLPPKKPNWDTCFPQLISSTWPGGLLVNPWKEQMILEQVREAVHTVEWNWSTFLIPSFTSQRFWRSGFSRCGQDLLESCKK